MTNTTTTIAPINRFMGLFTFVSSISYSPPSQAGSRTCIQEHSAILPSLAPLPNRLGQHKVGALIKNKKPGLLFSTHLTFEFPRIVFAGNSSQCIKTEADEEHDYYRSLLLPILGSVLPSQFESSVLPSLRLAAACNAGRILMQTAA